MDLPLLSTGTRVFNQSKRSRVGERCNVIHGLVQDWWMTTSSNEYLLSSFAGRGLWHLLLPGWWLVNLFVDVGTNAEPALIGVDISCILLVTCATSCLQRGTLWPDILISGMIGLFMQVNVSLTMAGYQSIAGVPNKGALISYALVANMMHLAMASFFGVHPSAIAFGFIITIAVCTSAGMGLYGLFGGLIGIAVLTIPSVTAMRTFTLHKALQILLDEAADGFLSVDPKTSIVIFASSKLDALFGCELRGLQFTKFLSSADAENLIDGMNQQTERTRAILVSCVITSNNLSRSFEARLIPYSKSSRDVKIYLQLAGEVRAQSLWSAEDMAFETLEVCDGSVIGLNSVSELQDELEERSTVSTTPGELRSGSQEIRASPKARTQGAMLESTNQRLPRHVISTIPEELGIPDNVMSEVTVSDSASQCGRRRRKVRSVASHSNFSSSLSDATIENNPRPDRMFSELRRKDNIVYYDYAWKITNGESYFQEAYFSILEDLAKSGNFEHVSCCNWHDALDRLFRLLETMSRWRSCSDSWPQEAAKWQCSACSSLQFGDEDGCWLCYEPRSDK